jgi:hypothetical protein
LDVPLEPTTPTGVETQLMLAMEKLLRAKRGRSSGASSAFVPQFRAVLEHQQSSSFQNRFHLSFIGRFPESRDISKLERDTIVHNQRIIEA